MPQENFDVEATPGFRLERLEVLNWGTFDRHIWTMAIAGENALLTGDIGSGKSTLVDALTTLLIPAHRVTYNKAAGAESKERTLATYVKGHYKAEKDEATGSGKAVFLRDRNSYSVLLAVFRDARLGQAVTLALVFWFQDGDDRPSRLWAVAERSLSIEESFTRFGTDMGELRKRLRRTDGVKVFDAFAPYASEFRPRLGVPHEQALDLLYQTVSMKSVGNLTEFIRSHMLEAPPVAAEVAKLCDDFENVSRAHEAVQKAKDQLSQLTPLVEEGDRLEIETSSQARLVRAREALRAYFAGIKAQLLRGRIQESEIQLARLADRLRGIDQELTRLRTRRDELKLSIRDHGGARLQAIAEEKQREEVELQRKQAHAQRFRRGCEAVEVAFPADAGAFHRLRHELTSRFEALDAERRRVETEKVDQQIRLRDLHEEDRRLETELESLRARRSNIELRTLEIRNTLCETLQIPDAELPFAGELLQVPESERDWEGAIERVLHQFGLSLLVPEERYAAVARYVERTHLRGRLVYYKVRSGSNAAPRWPADTRALPHRMDFKPDSAFRTWLEAELCERFDYVCTDDLAEFQRLPKALTSHGQTKSGGQRHEKDDRQHLGDRSRYVLGWSNADKIRALEARQAQLRAQGEPIVAAMQTVDATLMALETRRDALRDLLAVETYIELDGKPHARQLEALEAERRRIEEGSDRLRNLQAELTSTEQAQAAAEGQRDDSQRKHAQMELVLGRARNDFQEAEANLASATTEQRDEVFPAIAALYQEAFPDQSVNRVESCDPLQTEVRKVVQARIDAADKRINGCREKLVEAMSRYQARYPAETAELGAQVESLTEYREMLTRLLAEDLPRHEARFKELLNERTINDIALFQSRLQRSERDIEEKIGIINRSLRGIPYNAGTYIELQRESNLDPEVQAFKQDLKACTAENAGDAPEDLYAESRFLRVKALLDRFKGREGLADVDRRWTYKVVDVRNRFQFSASERWDHDEAEKEYYPDSAGKSGGQKEKLAYTVLASALAYQLGIQDGESRQRTFRFVMIDEAFGRGSDESARFGLELFRSLDLQLLIVTPLQKIHVLEDYVHSVHYVQNESGKNSQLLSFTLAEFKAEQARRTMAASS